MSITISGPKDAALQAENARRLLAMSRAERRRHGVRVPRKEIENVLDFCEKITWAEPEDDGRDSD